MKRGEFLKRIGLGALAVTVAPQLLATEEKFKVKYLEPPSILPIGYHNFDFCTNPEATRNVYYESKGEFPKHKFIIPRDKMDDLVIGDIVAKDNNGRMIYAEIVGIDKDIFMFTEAFPLLAP